ncbi:MAG TPA: hypothetical protein VMY35_18555 [Phycisphaerae bacterium]|nr:hypothetical protein [Phycisphaerae bacterium]
MPKPFVPNAPLYAITLPAEQLRPVEREIKVTHNKRTGEIVIDEPLIVDGRHVCGFMEMQA